MGVPSRHLQAVAARPAPWAMLALASLLSALGAAMVASATLDPHGPLSLGTEARAQLVWWAVSAPVAVGAAMVPFAFWRSLAVPGWIAALALQLGMLALAGTAMVPVIKGQANWLVLGPLRVQPIEFIKLAACLGAAALVASNGFDARRLGHVLLALTVAGIPAALNARSDLGSSLCFPPMVLAMLVAAGMRLRHLALLALLTLIALAGAVATLPHEGPKAYQWRRIQAWLHPEQYALAEGYQTARSVSAIGSGQVLGKGWGQGDQNRLGWIPEKHTDLIAAVAGEELGFAGLSLLVLLGVGLAWACLAGALGARDPCARAFLVGWTGLTAGQAGINLAVALGLMPVTGVTLPFVSYGGSSLLACHLGLGLAMAAAADRREA
jgi:cell division protein FtsW (lipid II flippase)